jgi:predicted tellurium resistance membrane protein TerC
MIAVIRPPRRPHPMENLFTFENLAALAMLTVLQAVLGFDNLLYISIESKRVEASKQAAVRRLGIGLAIALRIILLFVVIEAISSFQEPFAALHLTGIFEASINVHSAIVLIGGVFIIYTAVKEIFHMLMVEDLEGGHGRATRSLASAVFWIVLMNLVFSFDSILSAVALSDVFLVMATAIIISGILMIWLSDHVAVFLQKNRMYEVLGLFILFIVGILLVSEGGHLAHLSLFGHTIEPMAKSTFYFTIGILVVIELVQSRYRKRLEAQRAAELKQVAGH